MHIALIADAFPPLRSSAAVQLRDLSEEFARQGHNITVMVAAPEIDTSWKLELWHGVEILRLKTPRTKDIGYVRRALGELLMPFSMLKNLHSSAFANQKWDGVIWYSPSIFHGYFARALKKKSLCKGYLIIRDIFPEWAADMGLMRRKGLPYRFFDTVAHFQYAVADIIGVQTPGNLKYFEKWSKTSGKHLEVLQNWLSDCAAHECSIMLDKTALAGRKIFVYAGNMGIAQNINIMIDLAKHIQSNKDIGFLFVGRGSEAEKLVAKAAHWGLDNVIFHDEIHPDEIPALYAQCHVGLVALDPRHKSHNIPGKFISYMQSGLPVLASINAGNDLIEIIRKENVGKVSADNSVETLQQLAQNLIDMLAMDSNLRERCRNLYLRLFTPNTAVNQILNALNIEK